MDERTLLSIWFNGTYEEGISLERTLNFLAKFYGKIGTGNIYSPDILEH